MSEPTPAAIVLFSPFALVWQHAFPASIIARAASETNGTVSVVTCAGDLAASCVVFRSRQLDPEASPRGAKRLCSSCRRVSAQRITPGLDEHPLGDLLVDEHRAELEKYCGSLSAGPVATTPFHDQPIARFALYAHTITHRSETTDVAPEQLDVFRREVQSVGLAVLGGEEFARRYSPTTVIVSDLLYGANRGFVAGVRNICPNVRAVGLYDSPNQAVPFTTFQWVEDIGSTPFAAAKQAWPRLPDTLASLEGITDIGSYLKTSITGRRFRSFSGAVDHEAPSLRRDVLNVDRDAVIALVALSSEDEALAARESEGVSFYPRPYDTQLEWLDDISELAEDYPEVRFVIRPHPRFWANPANSQRIGLEERSRSFNPGLSLLTPERFASLYALLNEADVVLTSWSTVGIEARALGIPALAYGTESQGAPNSVLPAPSRREDYITELRATLEYRRWNFDTSVEMFRWLDFAWHRSNLDLSSVLPERFNHQTRASTAAKRDYLDLVGYRFLPATMARGDVRQAENLTSVSGAIRDILQHGIVAYAAAQSDPNQSATTETRAIRGVLHEIAALLPDVNGAPGSTLRQRLATLT
jgi:hypothetical protein